MAPANATDEIDLERYRDYLKLLASAQLGKRYERRVDASDIVQATLLDAHRNRGLFRGEDSLALAGWLRSILSNNIIDAVRAATRERRDFRREQPLDPMLAGDTSRAQPFLAAEQTSPSQYFARGELSVALAAAIAQLPEDQRDAVVLHHLQGVTLRELANHLDRSESAVAGLLYRGLKQLREILSRGETKE